MPDYDARIQLVRPQSGTYGIIDGLRQLLFDLHRRRVYRAVVTYTLAMWLVLQIADIVFPLFGISAWALKMLAGVAALGFPVTVIIAWVYQISPNGIVVDGETDGGLARASRQDLFVLLLTIISTLVFLLLLGASSVSEPPRIVVTATDVTAPDGVGTPIAAGLERELERRLFASGEIEPVSAVSDQTAATLVLWISVYSDAESVRVRALLLESGDRGASPYSDAFELARDSTELVQRTAARRIATGLQNALDLDADAIRLSSLTW